MADWVELSPFGDDMERVERRSPSYRLVLHIDDNQNTSISTPATHTHIYSDKLTMKLSLLPLLALPLTAIAAPSPNMAGIVGWAADKLVDGEMRTMDSWHYVDCGQSGRLA